MNEFDESKHQRDKDGKFKKKGAGDSKHNATKKKGMLRLGLQFFTEKAILTQTEDEIKSGIESLKAIREWHEYKIAHPWEFFSDWDKMSEREQKGRLWTWQKEIRNHTNGIKDRIEELRKRGVEYEE